MKKLLILSLFVLTCLFMNSISVDARHQVTTIWNTTIWIHSDIPDTEKYILAEEENKDKIYCKTKSDAEGNVIQTDWYNFCTGEFIKSEDGSTCTKEFRYPEYECVFAKGSNADKVYCRTVKDSQRTVTETRWFNYCNNELTKTEEGDTCTKEFKNVFYKCYKDEIKEEIIDVEEVPEEEEEEAEKEDIIAAEEPVTEEPEVTKSKTKTYCWAIVIAVLVVLIIAAAIFWKKREKPKKEK